MTPLMRVGATTQEHLDFVRQLTSSHQMRVRVKMLRCSDGHEMSDLSARLLDGQVNVDATADVTRSADLTINDPDHSVHLDARSASDGAMYLDRLIYITYGVYVVARARWYDVPIFKGPIVGMARDGNEISINCLGLDHVARAHTWQPMSFKKGHLTVTAIREIMRDRAGETRFLLPSGLKYRLPHPLALGHVSQPWVVCRTLAASINRQLYYNGAGICVLRRRPSRTSWTFKSGDGGTVLTDPQVTFDLSTISNVAWVRGRKAKGKPQIQAYSIASRTHPLSPWSLGRNGNPRYLVLEEENDNIRTNAAAKDRADTLLAQALLEGVEVSFDALPVPFLDPLDVVRVNTPTTSLTFVLRQFSIPLVHSGSMSVGTNRRVTARRGRIRPTRRRTRGRRR